METRAEPWDVDNSNNNDEDFDLGRGPLWQQEAVAGGAGMTAEEVAGLPPPPPRTPLQEQAFQNKYRPQHAQIPGQAVGTTSQPASSSLFRRVGSGGVCSIFSVLVCRSLNHYEYADQMMGALRVVSMVPAVGLFLGNVVCVCLSLVQSATSRQKARMKTMLSVDAVCEGLLLVYNMVLLLAGTSGGVIPKEEFVSRILTNVLFMSLCFTFAKARWVAGGTF
ncbi:unnamed protein product [Pylaiella littoralis]